MPLLKEQRRHVELRQLQRDRFRTDVSLCEQQYDYVSTKTTTDAVYALRILMEKHKAGQRELFCVFVHSDVSGTRHTGAVRQE